MPQPKYRADNWNNFYNEDGIAVTGKSLANLVLKDIFELILINELC